MGNHEDRVFVDYVHILMGFKRTKDNENSSTKCIRSVIKRPEEFEQQLEIFKSKLSILGGEWRIHRTVNARDTKKALRILMHTLIDFPEKAGYIDSLWRTALLQSTCVFGEKKFMFDVDFTDVVEIEKLKDTILCSNGEILEEVITPSGGRHLVTTQFDVREVKELYPQVELLRDGYIFVCKVGEK